MHLLAFLINFFPDLSNLIRRGHFTIGAAPDIRLGLWRSR